MQIKEINATKLPDIGIKRVAAYARVSSDKEAAIHSLSSQISYYNEYTNGICNYAVCIRRKTCYCTC